MSRCQASKYSSIHPSSMPKHPGRIRRNDVALRGRPIMPAVLTHEPLSSFYQSEGTFAHANAISCSTVAPAVGGAAPVLMLIVPSTEPTESLSLGHS